MIQRTKAFKTSDDQTFETLDNAKTHELELLLEVALAGNLEVSRGGVAPATSAASLIVSLADKVIDILTTTETSKAKARRVNGGKKKRSEKPAVSHEN